MSKETNAVFRLLTSLKLTLVLFLLVATASVLATLLPHGADIFHMLWFSGLLLLLCANLVACTIDRLPKTIRILRKPQTAFDSKKLSKFALSGSIATALSPEETRDVVEEAVGKTFGTISPVKTEGAFCAFSETGRWSRLMVHVAHLSVLVILIGALVGSFFGFKGAMNLTEGETSNSIQLAGSERSITLPFSVRCDKFTVAFYKTGMPREYKSDLEIIDNGRKVLSKAILVNHPLKYEGITLYQANYGVVLKRAAIQLTDQNSGKKISMVLPFQQPVTIPGTDHLLFIAAYQQDLMGFGRAIELAYGKVGQDNDFSARWILVDRPFHGNVIGNYLVHVSKAVQTSYTGIEVKKDPGVLLVWAGFILLTLSIGLAFYSSHKKLWVCIEEDGKRKKTIVSFAGTASRNPHYFEEKFEQLRKTLEQRLKDIPSKGKDIANTDNKGL